jgi:hypothetical protein
MKHNCACRCGCRMPLFQADSMEAEACVLCRLGAHVQPVVVR